MEKCPPAEACRDAFERMSKATIKMCLSTTGFGPNADKPAAQAPPKRAPQDPPITLQRKPLDYREATVTRIDSISPSRSMRNAMFSPDSRLWDQGDYARSQYRASFTQPPGQPQQYAMQRQLSALNGQILPVSQHPSYPGYFASSQHHSPREQYHFTDPFKGQQQQLQEQQPSMSQSLQSHPSQSFTDLNDLDFLNFPDSYPPIHHRPPYENITTGGPSVSHDAKVPLMPTMQSFDSGRPNGSGLDLRFGMGVDFQHDWSDGGGIDLFDGFFFGAGGGVNGYAI